MSLSNRQRHWLKSQAHHMRPVVTVGQAGLSDGVLNEIELALDHHELIKVKIHAGDRELRDAVIAMITARTSSDLIDRIGNTATLFRANPKKKDPLALPA